ncbi:MAG: hypothetical protein ACKVW3_04670 [Phycisphaerales bacterium]
MFRTNPASHRRLLVACAGLAIFVGVLPASFAIQPPSLVNEPDGRSLAGQRLSVPVTSGRIELAAQRAWTWNEPDGTRRLFLSGDARIVLGGLEMNAANGVVWIAPLPPGDSEAAPGVWQVYLYLDRAGSPTDDPQEDADRVVILAADRLPVRAIVRAQGGIRLRADRLEQGRPAEPLVGEGERSLASLLRRQRRGEPVPTISPDELSRQGLPVPPLIPGQARPFDPASIDDVREEVERQSALADGSNEPIFARDGVFSFATEGDVRIDAGQDENVAVLDAPTTVQYWDRTRDRTLQLSARRVVVFLDPGPLAQSLANLSARTVRGLYLEGGVTADSEGPRGAERYSIRAPRVFYDVRDGRGILLDAVFWTYDQKRGLPLYVRAKAIRQESAEQFRAEHATLTNTPFFEPDLALGASSVTITRSKDSEGDTRTLVDARNITIRAGGLPVFFWPVLRGDPEALPLRDLRIESSSGSGPAVRSTWNLFALAGYRPPRDATANLLLDWYFDRGPAVGTDLAWRGPTYAGGLLGYLVPQDEGRDLLATGVKKDHGGETRGMITVEHRAAIGDEWTLFAEGSYISDDTFIDGFFDPLARTRREFTNSLYLRRLRQNTMLFGEVRGTANDFIANQYLLQTPGYVVEKFPDAGYLRLADDLLEDYPGLLTATTQVRFTETRLRFADPTARELGFNTPFRSQALFGIAPDESIADALERQGLTEDPVARFDAREEVSAQLAAGPVSITPFAVGRLTAYDDSFESYSADADEQYRLWGSVGVSAATELQRVDNSAESRVFDVHRMRHILAPSITLWHATTSLDRTDIPVYDDEVESLAEGTAIRFNLDQTFQTQRGGPGRWRSVDFLTIGTELVVSSDDVDRESPIGRYITYRPEYSNLGGTFGTLDAAWQATEVLGLGVRTIFDFDLNQPAATVTGMTLQHSPTFSTFAETRYLNAQNQTLVGGGVRYELTPKYGVSASASYDTNLGELQNISGEVRRRYPSLIFGLGVTFNNITNETSLGVVLTPIGAEGRAARLSGIGGRNSAFSE